MHTDGLSPAFEDLSDCCVAQSQESLWLEYRGLDSDCMLIKTRYEIRDESVFIYKESLDASSSPFLPSLATLSPQAV